jgi:hypothetical protein
MTISLSINQWPPWPYLLATAMLLTLWLITRGPTPRN